MEDLYRILGIKSTASQEEIRERYLFLVKAYHPDRYTDPQDLMKAEEELKNINMAYYTIGDVTKRTEYDKKIEPNKQKPIISNVEVVRQFQIGLNAHDLSVIDRLVAQDYISHSPGIPENKTQWKSLILQEINAYEEILSIIENAYEQAGRIFLVLTEEFRQEAPFMGDPPNFKRCRMTCIQSYRIENGLIVELFPTTVTKYEQFD